MNINRLHNEFLNKLVVNIVGRDIVCGDTDNGVVGGDTNHGANVVSGGVVCGDTDNGRHPKITDIRIRGTILVLELYTPEGTSYFSNIRDIAYQFFIEKGILIRPLGNVIYLLPPYCISEKDLRYIYGCIEEFLDVI